MKYKDKYYAARKDAGFKDDDDDSDESFMKYLGNDLVPELDF